MKNSEPLRRDKGYLIHVGGLCPSVSEVCQDLFLSFIFISIKCSYFDSLLFFLPLINFYFSPFRLI